MHKHWQENGLTELSNFQHGTVLVSHLSNMSVCQIYPLLELPRSTVSAVIVMWKRLGATTAQQRSGRPHKFTEWDRRVLSTNRMTSVPTVINKFQTPLEAKSAQ